MVAAAVLVGTAVPAEADMQGEMNTMFGSLVNTTSPGVYNTQTRGVLSGGGLALKSKIVSISPVTLTPPSFKAGCGGIDLFGGSFSFINAAQFVQLMRSVAANAQGYAFQLALQTMCPSCSQIIADLQKKVQELNSLMMNSCHLAQGVVNDTASAFGVSNSNGVSLINQLEGVGDTFQSFTSSTGSSPVQQAQGSTAATSDLAKQVQGNLVWRALNQTGASGWFDSGDSTLYEEMMSLTGTIIVGPPAATSDGTDQALPKITLAGIIGIQDLIDGSPSTTSPNGGQTTINIYACDTTPADGCLSPTATAETITGFRQMILDQLEGTDSTEGIIQEINTGDNTMTSSQKNFMAAMPDGLGTLITLLAQKNTTAAGAFVRIAAPLIGIEMAHVVLESMLDATRVAIEGQQDPNVTKVAKMIEDARDRLSRDEQVLQARYGSMPDLVAKYRDLMTIMPASSMGGHVAVTLAR